MTDKVDDDRSKALTAKFGETPFVDGFVMPDTSDLDMMLMFSDQPIPKENLDAFEKVWDHIGSNYRDGYLCPDTLEKMEWSMTMRPNLHWALPFLREARDEIESLEASGWTNHGWFNGSVIASLTPDDTGLRDRYKALQESNRPYKLIGFWYYDDDRRMFLLTPPEEC